MNELIEKICKRTGLSEDKAKEVVEMVVDQLKAKLPPSVSGQVDNVASGQEASSLSSLLSKKSA